MNRQASRKFPTTILLLLLVCSGQLTCAIQEADAQSITPQQVEQLQKLSPEQREAVLRSLGQGGGGANQSAGQLAMPELVDPVGDKQDASETSVSQRGLVAGDTVVIGLSTMDDADVRHAGLRRALGSRVYELDRDGAIDFPKVGRIPLAGLTAEQIVVRLRSEPDLEPFEITAQVLSLTPTGAASLKPFGHELFDGVPTSFAPATDIPVPANYTIGVGDTVRIQIFGTSNASFDLVVARDGQVSLPNVGPVAVAGLSFTEMREQLVERIEQQSIGVSASVTMGELRSIRIFVLGDVNRPGSYTVSGLSTMTNALFLSGGLLPSGSMRDVQLKRNNRVVSRLDLYDLLLNGNTRKDARMQPGDVIFVPPVDRQASIFGEVLRPAIYEFSERHSIADLIKLAGGVKPSAQRGEAQVVRFNASGGRDMLTVSMSAAASEPVRAGDIVQIIPGLGSIENAVSLDGHVIRPSKRQWFQGMRLTDLVSSTTQLRAQADLEYVLIHRRAGANRLSKLVSANLSQALAARGSSADLPLRPLDDVIVFSLDGDRSERIRPLLEKIRLQSQLDVPAGVVTIVGKVRAPGEYPFEPNMRVGDLLRAAGGLLESAYVEQAELTRHAVISENGNRETVHQSVSLSSALKNDSENPLLQPHDFVTVREVPQWRALETVELSGEVRFPGTYAVRRGEFLSSVIDRAGGLTELAFIEGSVFLREELREREREQLDRLADRIRNEINSMPPNDATPRSSAEQLLAQLDASEPQGRLVIDVNDLLASPKNESVDILVKKGDRLIVPRRSQEVTVIGEVQYATSHIFSPGLDRRGYILKSGDLTANADRKRIYVVRANGNVVATSGSAWFSRAEGGSEIRPGDTIVVPLDADRIGTLPLWTSVTQIIYNIGVAAAAVGSF